MSDIRDALLTARQAQAIVKSGEIEHVLANARKALEHAQEAIKQANLAMNSAVAALNHVDAIQAALNPPEEKQSKS